MHAPQSLGIIGFGDFGRFLARLAKQHAPHLNIRIHDREIARDGNSFFSLEEASQSDVVIIAVSIRAFEAVLNQVLPVLKASAVLVDVNTVKEYPAALLRKNVNNLNYVTTHPMFGPFSYEKKGANLDGLKLVITDHNLPAVQIDAARNWLQSFGLDVVEMTPAAHDRLLAETLFLTHYIAQAVARAGFVRTDIDTVSFGFLMDAVESVKNDVELFRDVFRFNPYCEDTIARFEAAEWDLHTLLDSSRAAN